MGKTKEAPGFFGWLRKIFRGLFAPHGSQEAPPAEKPDATTGVLTSSETVAMPDPNPFETIPDPAVEQTQIDEIAEMTVALIDRRFPDPEPKRRGVHPKSHGCVKASFEVRSDVPEALRVGLFAEPGRRYDAWVRYSNASVRVAHDLEGGENGSRGMAIKVLGVEGRVLIEDGGDRNQDFLMINQPGFAFVNVADYHRLTQILVANEDDPTMFFAPLQIEVPGITDEDKKRIAASARAVAAIKSRPVANPLAVEYFGAAAFAFGPDRVMHFKVTPEGGVQTQSLPEDPGENYLGEALHDTMRGDAEVRFDFKIQVRGPGDGLGIEDATKSWAEAEVPWVDVARIVIEAPQRDVDTPERMAHCERLAFTPWHSLAEHQPLGGINRLRKAVYLASARHRGATL